MWRTPDPGTFVRCQWREGRLWMRIGDAPASVVFTVSWGPADSKTVRMFLAGPEVPVQLADGALYMERGQFVYAGPAQLVCRDGERVLAELRRALEGVTIPDPPPPPPAPQPAPKVPPPLPPKRWPSMDLLGSTLDAPPPTNLTPRRPWMLGPHGLTMSSVWEADDHPDPS